MLNRLCGSVPISPVRVVSTHYRTNNSDLTEKIGLSHRINGWQFDKRKLDFRRITGKSQIVHLPIKESTHVYRSHYTWGNGPSRTARSS
jgi:hypothetical protein